MSQSTFMSPELFDGYEALIPARGASSLTSTTGTNGQGFDTTHRYLLRTTVCFLDLFCLFSVAMYSRCCKAISLGLSWSFPFFSGVIFGVLAWAATSRDSNDATGRPHLISYTFFFFLSFFPGLYGRPVDLGMGCCGLYG
ncbi:hypothetical protein M440DRAFT_73735 [Trichoderma longibrachiatum ATCC 18648]|uniref:Uncharacterized protein n=1 Tax=Trichoderma longibrachiatum ATCC 18648 TaxID=983965 RepID=A0A2T4CHG8_TRILO|nr:hypothetical protein M440DRAFT_73735 [Trichoderma longibrachiatum ATCC 18648]